VLKKPKVQAQLEYTALLNRLRSGRQVLPVDFDSGFLP
jgi:hypothetical protein